jgi:cyclopropane-fatty-acyl-phospholipid synthase
MTMATQADIESHYDVDNDFFALFLDENYLGYTCGVWGNATTLEQSQLAKFERLCRYANVQVGDHVLDVGCGWGGLLKYIVDTYPNSHAHGVTLSSNQANYINNLHKPKVTADNLSWKDYSMPTRKYDAIVCVCALEHFATFEENVAGKQREVYKTFFDWCLNASTPEARFGIQSIVITRPPKNLGELRGAKYLQEKVFPGSALSSISDIQAAIVDKYEIVEAKTIGQDYVLTLEELKKNLIKNKVKIITKYGQDLFDHYITYFDGAICCFAEGYWDVFQASLKRATSPKVLPE